MPRRRGLAQVLAGGAVLGALLVGILATPWLRGLDPYAVDLAARLEPPTAAHLLGREALALTELRPGGFAQVGDERLSVVLESGLAAPGTRLIVTSVEGYRILVRPADGSTSPPPSGASA